MKTKFKVGDKVRAIDDRYKITRKSNNWEGVVIKVHDNGRFDATTTEHTDHGEIGANRCQLNPEHFELIQPETIIITNDGRVTTACLKQGKMIMKTRVAKCSPEDKFSLETGAKLALNRLFGTEFVKQDYYEPGDTIKLKDDFDGLKNLVHKMLEWQGQVVTVAFGDCDGVRISEDDGELFWNNHFIEGKVNEEEAQKYKVGDIVKVVNSGKSYTTYESWFEENNQLKIAARYVYGYLIDEGEVVRILAIGKHGWDKNKTICAVESIDTASKGVYLIEIEGLKKGLA